MDDVTGFFASLHASVGQARLGLGDGAGAQVALDEAKANLDAVPEGSYQSGLIGMIATLKQAASAAGSRSRHLNVRY